MSKTHIASDETLQRIATALEAMAVQDAVTYDEESGEYTNASIASYLNSRRNGLAYGVSIPKGSATACTKTGSNAGMANPTPGVIGTPAVDPYLGVGPFFFLEVNGYADPDGTPHVTAINGDGSFARDGSNGNVWILAPTLYWSFDDSGDDAVLMTVSDTELSGLEPQPQAYLPSGGLRPYMLYAKYAGGLDSDGVYCSRSGLPAYNRKVSHNTLLSLTSSVSTGYSGKSLADDWYVKAMFLLKYATKNSQSVFGGCTSYSYQCAATVAESSVERVIVSSADAANLLVGSSCTLGTAATGTDRGAATAYDVFDAKRIAKIEAYDDENSAVYFDVSSAFSTEVGYCLSTAPWHSGSCDSVEGDGSPYNPKSNKEPFVIQGIECMVGLYEVLSGVIISSDGENGSVPYVVRDTQLDVAALSDDYAACAALPTGDSAAWHYPLYPAYDNGLLYATTEGASTSTGMCDGTYTVAKSTSGAYEWLSLGRLNTGSNAGLWSVNGSYGLAVAWWYVGSRLSCTGRSRG